MSKKTKIKTEYKKNTTHTVNKLKDELTIDGDNDTRIYTETYQWKKV